MNGRLRRIGRFAMLAPPVALGLAAAAATFHSGAPFSPLCAAAAWTHHAALVVEHGDGRSIRLCIGFDASTIGGEDLLRASGLELGTVSYGSLGDAVCQIDGEPASYPPTCFTSSSPYWEVFVSRRGGAWTAADHGVSGETFSDGDAEGFRYAAQSSGASPPPSPTGVCSAAAPHTTSAAASTSHPSARAPATPAPTGAPLSPPAAVTGSAVQTPGVINVIPARRPPAAMTAAASISAGWLAAAVSGGALLALLAATAGRARRP